jgi:primosomal protein N' (replication factor Y)
VKSLAGTAEVVEMSSDTDGEVGPAQIVIGTEAALHRVVSADAVIFLDFDSELLAPRLRASELSLALLARAGRVVATGMALPASAEDDESNRAGMRSITGAGTIIVQTRQPEDLVLQSAAGGDPGMLVQPEMRLRSELSLPPVTAMAEISGVAAATYADALKGDLESFGVEQPDVPAPRGSVTITGPVDGRWAVIARDTSTLCDLLERVARPAGRVRVSVDPFRA